MDGLNFGQRYNSPAINDETAEEMDVPEVNSDLIATGDLADVANIHNAPLAETIPYTGPAAGTVVAGSWVSTPVLDKAPVDETMIYQAPAATETAVGSLVALLNREESEHFRTRWNEIQGKFVDEPRDAVQQADVLVSDVIGKITDMFTSEHGALENEWKLGNDVSTEDLRKALQRYRSFFNRLVV